MRAGRAALTWRGMYGVEALRYGNWYAALPLERRIIVSDARSHGCCARYIGIYARRSS